MNCPHFPGIAFADDADLFKVSVEPDVLVILDCSGSMTLDVNGNYTWGDGSADYPGRDTNGDGFANDSRMYIVKGALTRIIGQRENLRWGFETFPHQTQTNHYSSFYRESPYGAGDELQIPWQGGYGDGDIQVVIAQGEPAHLQQMYNLFDNVHQIQELRADGATAIGGAMYTARNFLTAEIQTDFNGKMICRRYFCILVGDGEENAYPANNPHNPYTETSLLREIVIDSLTFDVETYTIGVAVAGGAGEQCLDSIAKLGGTYHYYPATSLAALDTIFNIVASDIERKSFAFAAPEVPAIRSKYYNSIYFASFMPSYDSFWKGYLRAYRLNMDGTFPQDTLGNPANPCLWEAGLALSMQTPASRNIYTEKSGSRVAFTSFSIDSVDLGVPGDSVAPLIDWVRGTNPYGWKLGDIFHSWPVCVGPPSPHFFDEGYDQFKIDKAHRAKMIFAGANDGMLHAFDAGTYDATGDSFTDGTGNESWAFIPSYLLPRLKNLRTEHGYYVDGTPIVFDAWFSSGPSDDTKDPDEWKTVLLCGERRAGDHYFALDVTNTTSPSFLWNFSDADLAETWSTPGVGRVRIGGKERWIAAVGGGLCKAPGTRGRAIYFLDATDGSIIWKFTDANMTYSLPAAPSLIDRDNDGYVDEIFIGDINGQLWKLEIRGAGVAEWKGYRVFASTKEQPMYYPPACAYDRQGNFWMFVGGGDRDSVRSITLKNRFYGIRDNGQTTPYTDADLKDVTGTGAVNTNGWYITFDKNEKCIAKAVVFGEVAYFTTYEPTFDEPCLALGTARLYRVAFTTGKALPDQDRATVIGEGLPVSPQVSVTPEGDFAVTIGASRGEIISETIDAPDKFKKVIYWKEHKY
jgi:Tfp pilus tip-associated adhesin PilY1